MLTYRCGNVTHYDAAVGGGGGGVFVPPASETNEAQPPNKNYEGVNARETSLLVRVVNAETTQIEVPESVGLAPVNLF